MAKKSSGSKIYLGISLPWIVNLILVIIPVTSWILGFITRFMQGKIVAGVIRIFLGWIIWIADIIYFLSKGKLCSWLS